MKKIYFLFLFFLSYFSYGQWYSVPVPTADIPANQTWALISNGNYVYAGTANGVFVSSDKGSNWATVDSGLTNKYVVSLAVLGSHLFAGTNGGGLFVSTDNGSNWKSANTGLSNLYVLSLAVYGSDLLAGTGNGMFLSADTGATWMPVNTGMQSKSVGSIGIVGNRLFAGTTKGVFVSRDTGATWASSGLDINDIGAFAVQGTNLFAASRSGNFGVFLSTDTGVTWKASGVNGPQYYTTSLARSGNYLFAGTDNGGVFISDNNGVSWRAVNVNLTNKVVKALTVSGTDLFAGTRGKSNFIATIPALTFKNSFSATNVTCYGGADGSATVTVSGGTPPYTFSWNTKPAQSITQIQTTMQVTGLINGIYTVSITDSSTPPATISVSISISQPPKMILSTTSASATCKDLNGSASAMISVKDIPPYSYSWSNSQTGSTATGLASGSYSVTVKDGNSCSQTATVQVSSVGPVFTSSHVNLTCNGNGNGSVTLSSTGGISPYIYSWRNGVTQTSNVITGLSATTYTVTVKDTANCQSTLSVTLTQPPILNAGISATSTSAMAVVGGGVSPYTYSWSTTPVQTGVTATGLTLATSYTVQVKDKNSCTVMATAIALSPNKTRYWIQFKDKNNSPYSIANPSAFLTPRAILRRSKQGIAIKENDLPVNRSYIDSVLKTGAAILNTSRWFNAIIIQTGDPKVLQKVMALPFVSKGEVAGMLKKDVVPDNKWAVEQSASASSFKEEEVQDLLYGASYQQVNVLGGVCLHNLGYHGEGMEIAIIDGGFTGTNYPAFDSLHLNNRLLGSRNFSHANSAETHGMSVLSVMGAFASGSIIGIAPRAKYWLLTSEVGATESRIEEDYWVSAAEFADSVGVDVISSSLGYTEFDDPSENHTYADMNGRVSRCGRAATIAAGKGILVAVAVGNAGNDPWHYIGTPSDADSILSVGAVDNNLSRASFSSVGPTSDNRIAPNVMAIGLNGAIVGASGAVVPSSGTSFATPLIAGGAACLWQACPGLKVMDLIQVIKMSGNNHHSPDAYNGFGVPDLCNAMVIAGTKNNALKNEIPFSVTPVPFSDALEIQFSSGTGQHVTLELMDIHGKKIISRDLFFTISTPASYKIEGLESYSPGVYLLRMITPDNCFSKKIVKG